MLSPTERAALTDAAAAARSGATVRWRVTLRPRALYAVVNGRERLVFSSLTARSFEGLLREARGVWETERKS